MAVLPGPEREDVEPVPELREAQELRLEQWAAEGPVQGLRPALPEPEAQEIKLRLVREARVPDLRREPRVPAVQAQGLLRAPLILLRGTALRQVQVEAGGGPPLQLRHPVAVVAVEEVHLVE
jgi:hypothetical protein